MVKETKKEKKKKIKCKNIFVVAWRLRKFRVNLNSFNSFNSMFVSVCIFFCVFSIHCVVKTINGRISRENLKMNIQKIPLITTLLRASRNQDEEIIRHVLASILTDEISPDDLNATDCSGRVS